MPQFSVGQLPNPEITGFGLLAGKYAFAAGLLECGDVLESADGQREVEFGEEGLQVVVQALAPP